MIDVLIVTAPFTYTLGPSMAPALLKSCVSQQQISAQAWDLSAEFNFENQSNKYYSEITAWMQQPELKVSVEAFDWYSKLIDSYATKIIEIFPTCLAISCLTQNSQRFTEDLCYTVRLKSVDKIKIIIRDFHPWFYLYNNSSRMLIHFHYDWILKYYNRVTIILIYRNKREYLFT